MNARSAKPCLILLFTLVGLMRSLLADEPQCVVVKSPDGTNTIELSGGGANGLQVDVTRDGAPVVTISALTVHLAEGGELSGKAKLIEKEHAAVNEQFSPTWGKTSRVVNHASRATARLVDPSGIAWEIDLVAYDDGVAYRYRLPEQDGLTEFTLVEESSEVRFADSPTIHYTAFDRFTNDHEVEFRRDALRDVAGPLVDLPLLAVWDDGRAAAITEARVRDFPNLYLEPTGKPGVLHTRLSPLRDRKDACVVGRAPHASPWRVVLVGDEAGKLLESNLLLCLNDPPPEGDYSWAAPGKTTWHWWNGTFDHEPEHVPGMNLESHKRYIDFCAANGFAYHAVVSDRRPWHMQAEADFAPHPDSDILTPRPELDLPEILKYAKKRGVGIRLWVHWKPLDAHLEEAFRRYEDWGISGLMVDFLDSDDQQIVNFCERVLKAAARHKLHIQFHGSYKPSGEQRTFPYLFNREGVLNLEYLKWSHRCTPPHNVEAAYVRALAGPMDYHLGGFRSIARDKFVARSENPYVLGTRCHHLAMYVVYENPMPQVCDTPERYEGQMGFEFIVEVPTTWDETRFVIGTAGEYIVMARRKRSKWYLGGMSDWTPREVKVPLDFLGNGKYRARLFVDGSMDEDEPNAIRVEKKVVDAATPLRISMAPGGGFAAVVEPE